jgi:hypothetical protein
MPAPLLQVDHATIAGRDLPAMQQALSAVGLVCEYGGPHSNHATEMAALSFADGSYLELIALQPHADPKAVDEHYWKAFLRGDAGPCAWAVRSADVAAEVSRLRAASIEVSGPFRAGRQRPDGVRLEWETAQIGSGPSGTFFPFLIRDFTPRANRAFPGGKPTTTSLAGVSKVVLGTRDLDAAVRRFQRAYGLADPRRQDDASFGTKLAWFEGTPVVIAAPLNAQSWLAHRLDQFGEIVCAFVLARGTGGKYRTKPGGDWFGKRIDWFDPLPAGWRLGLE